jgi:hypothetical protein
MCTSLGGCRNAAAAPYRFLFVRGVKSFGEGSGFAAAVFRGLLPTTLVERGDDVRGEHRDLADGRSRI